MKKYFNLIIILSILILPFKSFATSTDSIPKMTSNTAPSGTVTYSTQYTTGGNGAYKAFDDNDDANGWLTTNVKSGWLAYEFTSSKRIVGYGLLCENYVTYGSDERAPKTWTFEGYNGSTWDVLDTQTNISGWVNGTLKEFTFSNANSYTKYRINVTDNQFGSGYLAIGELQMYEYSAPTLQSVSVNPDSQILDVNNTQQLSATALYSDSSTADVTSSSTWTSSDENVATVSASGLVTSIGSGTCNITATYNSQSDYASITVNEQQEVTLTKIEIMPEPTTIENGTTQQLSVVAYYSDSSTVDVTSSATFESSNQSYITVNAGLLTAVGIGSATITATYQTMSDSINVEVMSGSDLTNYYLSTIDKTLKIQVGLMILLSFMIMFIGLKMF